MNFYHSIRLSSFFLYLRIFSFLIIYKKTLKIFCRYMLYFCGNGAKINVVQNKTFKLYTFLQRERLFFNINIVKSQNIYNYII